MNQSKLAEARRLYHHVINGGTLTANDVSFMVVALEEAYEEIETENKDYGIEKDLLKTPEGTCQEETGQGTEALREGDRTDTEG